MKREDDELQVYPFMALKQGLLMLKRMCLRNIFSSASVTVEDYALQTIKEYKTLIFGETVRLLLHRQVQIVWSDIETESPLVVLLSKRCLARDLDCKTVEVVCGSVRQKEWGANTSFLGELTSYSLYSSAITRPPSTWRVITLKP
jgi:hypothetical protein